MAKLSPTFESKGFARPQEDVLSWGRVGYVESDQGRVGIDL